MPAVPATEAAMQRQPKLPRNHAQTADAGPPSKIGEFTVEAMLAAILEDAGGIFILLTLGNQRLVHTLRYLRQS